MFSMDFHRRGIMLTFHTMNSVLLVNIVIMICCDDSCVRVSQAKVYEKNKQIRGNEHNLAHIHSFPEMMI